MAQKEVLPYVLVLEDDISFREGFDGLLEKALSELPEDWDALWLGGTIHKVEQYSGSLLRLLAGTGGYGVLIRETMYSVVIELLEQEQKQSDICYMSLQRKFNCYHTAPNLILHKPGYSTIQKKHVDYPALYK